MTIKTGRFGQLTVGDDETIVIPLGILGGLAAVALLKEVEERQSGAALLPLDRTMEWPPTSRCPTVPVPVPNDT